MTPQHQILAQRPKQILYATRILWSVLCGWALKSIGLTISVLCMPFLMSKEELASYSNTLPSHADSILTLILLLLMVFLNAYFIQKMKSGSNGARWVLFSILIVKIYMSVFFLIDYSTDGRLLSLVLPILTLVEMVALYILYTNPAAAWFKRIKEHKKEKMHLISIQMPPQPSQLRIAIRLFWACLLFSFLYSIALRKELMDTTLQSYEGVNLPSNIEGMIYTITLFSYLFIAWLVYKIAVGRNWARMTVLTFTIIGLLMIAAQFGLMPKSTITNEVTSIYSNPLSFKGMASYLLQIINFTAVCLLFSKSSNSWYRKQKELEKQLNSSIN
jgi:hypothetical protein